MKLISFSANEILPGLLNKSKDQTIRPLFDVQKAKVKGSVIKEKELRFSKGEPVRIFWKQRTRFKHFCKGCGAGIHGSPHLIKNLHYECGDEFFDKIMGGGTITEAFKVYMSKDRIRYVNGVCMSPTELVELARRDSFKSPDRMFNWFNRQYNLSSTWLPFGVYRWSWEWD